MIGILTFHRSHNYGSVLQAYALQQWLQRHGYSSEIIDLYTNESKEVYSLTRFPHSIMGMCNLLLRILMYPKNRKKWKKFIFFQEKNLKLSKSQYVSLENVEGDTLEYTTYITGSDQIWNTACYDFNSAYFLTFVKNTCNRIAYAPSFGPIGENAQNSALLPVVEKQLKKYNFISVREEKSADFVEKIIGMRPAVVIDPTLLLTKTAWQIPCQCQMKLPEHYIFFYTLKHGADEYEIVKRISKRMGLPVIITNISSKYAVLSDFKWKLEAGPWDFLHLIQHADLVLSSSFHGTVFSIIFEKLFYSINGSEDNRISSLLNLLNISERSLDLDNLEQILSKKNDSINYTAVKENLSIEIQKSEEFLYTALKGEKSGDLLSE